MITGSLGKHRSVHLGALLRELYARQVMRLQAALLACVLMVLVIPGGSEDRDLHPLTELSRRLGVSNLYLYRQSTVYLASAKNCNRFVHTWSLNVETQFSLLSLPMISPCVCVRQLYRHVDQLTRASAARLIDALPVELAAELVPRS